MYTDEIISVTVRVCARVLAKQPQNLCNSEVASIYYGIVGVPANHDHPNKSSYVYACVCPPLA